MNLAQATSEVSGAAVMLWTWAADFLPRITGAAFILFIAFTAANWAGRGVDAMMGRTGRVDMTIRPVIVAIIRYAILILAFVAVLGQLGVQTASVLAVLGAAGLAIGLALQGTLANIAAGIMLLWLRPFQIGEHIEVGSGGVNGKVLEVGLFATLLESPEGLYRFIPNAELWPKVISNFTRYGRRAVHLTFIINHKTDVAKARAIVATLLREDDRVLKTPEPEAVIDGFVIQGAQFTVRAWTSTANYAAVTQRTAEEIVKRFAAAGVDFGK
jgi:small conductance mechanosensitive channel